MFDKIFPKGGTTVLLILYYLCGAFKILSKLLERHIVYSKYTERTLKKVYASFYRVFPGSPSSQVRGLASVPC